MTGAMELQPDDELRSSLSIGSGLDDAVRSRRSSLGFVEGIGKLIGNISGDCQKKIIGLTVRMSEATGLTGVKS
ncbi:hypothetical protein B296_00028380 [Ensete ventricosum]|uniref:Uncharacterized protein n=1 Tax=Ensete ventricosum TaxID=4639 RepID=A0A426XR29_ENSVE|nr:hypothetical protein B296_00028380 [Ensete ventricosum]